MGLMDFEMNLSTPFPVNIISQMRAEQWRRPEELYSSSLVGRKGSHTPAMRNLFGGETYTGFCDSDECRVTLMETNRIPTEYVKI